MKTTAEMIAVMQASEDGKPIEFRVEPMTSWVRVGSPSWGWDRSDYRVAVTKPSVDWSHLSRDIVAIATDGDGYTWGYFSEPIMAGLSWYAAGHIVPAVALASFTPGTCDWKDSLVLRPEGV